MSYFEKFRRTNDNVFDMQKMKQQMEREGSEEEIQRVVLTAVDRIDKDQCFAALRKYYLNAEHFPDNHRVRLPSECSIPIVVPKARLRGKYLEYGKNIGNGVFLDNNGFGHPHRKWRVYITDEFFGRECD